MKEHNILGVILAGGKSSRFGSNKSLSILANNKLIEHGMNLLPNIYQKLLLIVTCKTGRHFLYRTKKSYQESA